jgi:hypothetical protein
MSITTKKLMEINIHPIKTQIMALPNMEFISVNSD